MAFTLRVHDWKQTGDGDTRIVGVKPYIRLFANPGPPLFLQSGGIYYEDGTVPKVLPSWFQAEVDKCTAKALAEVKWSGIPTKAEKTGDDDEGDDPAIPTADITDELMTLESAETTDFIALKAYANKFGVTATGKTKLIEKLKDAGKLIV